MSALAWLFGLGALGIVFPVLFHLIRRTPKGELAFSSLMFLQSSPPRLTRRSRLDDLLLLLIRAAALLLVALAFMRPFLEDAWSLSQADVPGQRVAMLLDTSASMRRGDLFQKAKETILARATDVEDGDRVALFTFDRELRAELDFDSGSEQDRVQNLQAVMQGLSPTWEGSDLGKALVELADRMERMEDDIRAGSKMQIIVVSDLQEGASLEALQGFQWPSEVLVDLEIVSPAIGTNAWVRRIDNPDPGNLGNRPADTEYVLVSNTSRSQDEVFEVQWAGVEGPSTPTTVFVPPGSSKVLAVPRTGDSMEADELVLTGDDFDFDNRFFVAPLRQKQRSILYFGSDAEDDPETQYYYLKRAFPEQPQQRVDVLQRSPEEGEIDTDRQVDLMILARPPTGPESESIARYLQSGGCLLVVLSQMEMVESVQSWTGTSALDRESAGEATRSQYRIFERVDFGHPLFSPFIAPPFNDFTQLRFWRTIPVVVDEECDVLASFDDQSPALWFRDIGPGRCYTIACGWDPRSSQLALSSKFLPIMNRLLDLAVDAPPTIQALQVGQRIPLPVPRDDGMKMVTPSIPAGLELSAALTYFEGTTEPGNYRLIDSNGGEEAVFAVNLARAESLTDPMPVERLQSLNIALGRHLTEAEERENQRRLQREELEGRQKLWKWLLFGAIGCLLLECGLSSRANRIADRATLAAGGQQGVSE